MLAKLERANRWAAVPLLLLTLGGGVMLYAGAPGSAWNWYIPLWFIVAIPSLALGLARLFAFWQGQKLPPQDIPDEWR